MKAIVVCITTPDSGTAEAIARRLVDMKLAACAQVSGPVGSVYRWEGSVEAAEEWKVEVKTREELFGELSQAVKQVHPYEVPEIIAVPVSDAYGPYLKWLFEATEEAG